MRTRCSAVAVVVNATGALQHFVVNEHNKSNEGRRQKRSEITRVKTSQRMFIQLIALDRLLIVVK